MHEPRSAARLPTVVRAPLFPVVVVGFVLCLILGATACTAGTGKGTVLLSRQPLPAEPIDGPSVAVEPTTSSAAPSPPPEPILAIDYRVEVRSPDPAVADAAAVITSVLEDPRGWQQANIDFRQSPDAPYTILVVEGEEAQALCQPYDVGGRFSCQNGPLVVLNAIRWREAVPHWPGDVDSYRTMLVNHEVGHLLGMHHIRCTEEGTVAPVMEQQSGTLRGCLANPWPTPIELALAATHQFVIAPAPLDVAFPQ